MPADKMELRLDFNGMVCLRGTNRAESLSARKGPCLPFPQLPGSHHGEIYS
jgi:hypothetical protein